MDAMVEPSASAQPADDSLTTQNTEVNNVSSTCPIQASEAGSGAQHPDPDQETACETAEERNLLFRRDRVATFAANSDISRESEVTRLTFTVDFSGCSDEDSVKVIQQFLAAKKEMEDQMRPYGALVEAKRKCVQITLDVHSEGQTGLLQQHLKNGQFVAGMLKTAKIDAESLLGAGATIRVSDEQMDDLKRYMQAETLPDDVSFTYCLVKGCWFWSPNKSDWYSCQRVPVHRHAETRAYLKPNQEDVSRVIQLRTGRAADNTAHEDCLVCQSSSKPLWSYQTDKIQLSITKNGIHNTEIAATAVKQSVVQPVVDSPLQKTDAAMDNFRKTVSAIDPKPEAFRSFHQQLQNIKICDWQEDLQVRKYFDITDFPEFVKCLESIIELKKEESLDMLNQNKHITKRGSTLNIDANFTRDDCLAFFLCFVINKHLEDDNVDLIFAKYTLKAIPILKKDKKEFEVASSWFGGFYERREEKVKQVAFSQPNMARLNKGNDKDDYVKFKVLDGFAAHGLVADDKAHHVRSMLERGGIMPMQSVLGPRTSGRELQSDADSEEVVKQLICHSMYMIDYNVPALRRFGDKLQHHKTNTWHENVQVKEQYGIIDFEGYAKGLKEILSMPERDYNDLLCTYKYVRCGEVNKIHVNYKYGEMNMRYAFFALYKRKGSQLVDLVYANYSLHSEPTEKTIELKTESKWLWGWVRGKSSSKIVTGRKELEAFDDLRVDVDRDKYFICRVLDKFVSAGLLDDSKLKKIH